MKVGVYTFATDRDMRPDRVAREVEDRGFTALMLPEHAHTPAARRPGGGREGRVVRAGRAHAAPPPGGAPGLPPPPGGRSGDHRPRPPPPSPLGENAPPARRQAAGGPEVGPPPAPADDPDLKR